MPDKEIIPSILVENLDEFVQTMEICENFAQTVHWDIMDGQFVENTSFSSPVEIMEVDTTMNIEAHLMVEHPEEMLENLEQAGVTRVIVHAEASDDLGKLIEKMKVHNFERGVALNPETGVEEVAPFIKDLHMVMIMMYAPGAAGQTMMMGQLKKVEELRKKYPNLNISVDGGIKQQTIRHAIEAGANRFVANTAIFDSPDPEGAFVLLQNLIE